MAEAITTADRSAQEMSKPLGCMVERFWVMDRAGLYFAGDDEFTYDQDQAVTFSDEDEAEEISASIIGTTVERFHRWSRHPDFVADPKGNALSEALNYVQHWRRDRQCNMAPSLESLNHVEAVIRKALAA